MVAIQLYALIGSGYLRLNDGTSAREGGVAVSVPGPAAEGSHSAQADSE
jgi:hypothetical protein